MPSKNTSSQSLNTHRGSMSLWRAHRLQLLDLSEDTQVRDWGAYNIVWELLLAADRFTPRINSIYTKRIATRTAANGRANHIFNQLCIGFIKNAEKKVRVNKISIRKRKLVYVCLSHPCTVPHGIAGRSVEFGERGRERENHPWLSYSWQCAN